MFTPLKGVGYCLTLDCVNYCKGSFLLGVDKFFCPVCNTLGEVNLERREVQGEGFISMVRVEFDYCPFRKEYRGLAVISMNIPGATFTLYSPIVKTDKRAKIIAESILSIINYDNTLIDRTGFGAQPIISFDEPREMFQKRLEEVSERWKTVEKAIYHE